MELYKKKINIERKNIRDNNEKKENENIYLLKKQKKIIKRSNLDLSSESKKNNNSKVENTKNKKKLIREVIHIGKNRRFASASCDLKPHYERLITRRIGSEGENDRYIKAFINSYNSSLNESNQMIDSRLTDSKSNKYFSINDYIPTTYSDRSNINFTKRKYKTIETDSFNIKRRNYPFYINVNSEESQNEISSSLNFEGYKRYPYFKIMNRVSRILKEKYEKISGKKKKRNRTINAMPRIRKENNNNIDYKININKEDNDVIELIREIEELQIIIEKFRER